MGKRVKQTAALAAVTTEAIGLNDVRAGLATVQVIHSGVATYSVEGSLDGTNWVALTGLSALTADALVNVDMTILHVRLNVTAYTSGSVQMLVVYD